ncbi:MAG: alpha/beta fold hydrolase [Bryobacteraceae bacterium]|nr:alpha/beta fold hydrolase [Bryobacteraceae bacterium]
MRSLILFALCSLTVAAQPAAQPPKPFVAPEDIAFRDVDIFSEGTRMHGEVFVAKNAAADKKLPTILMAHGWGGATPAMRRDAILFARAGYFVLTFDYRGWGGSDSRLIPVGAQPKANAEGKLTMEVKEVREVVDPVDFATDWFNAIHWLAAEPQVDMDRLGVWGSSFSGGLVVYVAARDPRVKALHSQVGALDGRDMLKVPELRKMAYEDATRMARGEKSYPKPGEPFEVVRFTADGKREVTGKLRGHPSYGKMMVYFPVEDVNAAKQCAMQFVIAEKEELFNNGDHAIKAYNAFQGKKNLVTVPGITHYGIYSTAFQQSNKLAIEWYDKHLKN